MEKLHEEEELVEEIAIEEVERAVKQMRKNKAPGTCNITAEMLQETGKDTIKWLHRVICKVWDCDAVPEDWRQETIIPIHKKGNRKDCNNSRGIALLSVPGKVFTRIILNRIKDNIDKVLRENQCGFRQGRGCTDQIFLIRQMIEKKREFNNDLYICFIDFAQAYDSIWRKGAWGILGKYGIQAKYINLIKSLYNTIHAVVRIEGLESKEFEIQAGFRQGCILSPSLFNVILDYILRRLEKLGQLGKLMEPKDMEDAEYADDTCLMAEGILRIMELTELLAIESEKLGLKINFKKTKLMVVTRHLGPHPKLKIQGKEIETVGTFTYLGSELNSDASVEIEIKRRMAMAGSAFNRLKERIFRRHDINMKVKLRILNACILPVLTYGSETWNITDTMEKKLDACENNWLRRILRISYKEHKTNEEIRQRTRQPLVSTVIRKKRLKWLGHTLRMEDKRLPKRIYNYKPEGKRRPGRQRTRWKDRVEKDLDRIGLKIEGRTSGRQRKTLEEIANDRDEWRFIVSESMAGHS